MSVRFVLSVPAGALAVSAVMLALIGSTAMQASEPDFDGVWRSRGYGWTWTIDGDRIKPFHVARRTCIAVSKRSIEERGLTLRLKENGQQLRVTDGDSAYFYTFDRIAALPEVCHSRPTQSPVSVIDAVSDFFVTHYPFFERRDVDWSGALMRAKEKIGSDTKDAELFEILVELLSQVPDNHVSLAAHIDGKTREYESGQGRTMTAAALQAQGKDISLSRMLKRWHADYWKRGIGEDLLQSKGHVAANGRVQYGVIGGDIGYLNVRSMADFDEDGEDDARALNEALDGAMALFAKAKAVIVDITLNDGGYDYLARNIASRFTATRELAYSKQAGDAPAAKPQLIYVEPFDGPRFTGPVYLLTSDVTVSAAEILTMAMRALPNVTHLGETTRGSLSDELYKPLPNGWWLSLSNEVYLDSKGVLWEGTGIRPEVEIEVFSRSDVTIGHTHAVRAVVDRIRRRDTRNEF